MTDIQNSAQAATDQRDLVTEAQTANPSIGSALNTGSPNGGPTPAAGSEAPTIHKRRGRKPGTKLQPKQTQPETKTEAAVDPDPIVLALFHTLPGAGAEFSAEARKKWLAAISAIFDVVYRQAA
jgi:hypothetical protein